MPHPRIIGLSVFHLIAGLAAGSASADSPAVSSALFLGFLFAQTALLGIWAGLGATRLALRLTGLAAGSVYLALLCGWGINETDVETFVVMMLPTILVALVAGGVRISKGMIRRIDDSPPERREVLQFTIRHLMWLTFVVACLTLFGKLLAARIRGADVMAFVIVLAICHATVGVTAIWAKFGFKRPVARGLVCIVIALGAGYIGGTVVDRGQHFWAATAGIEAIVLLSSLQIVRSAGYRLVPS